MILEFIIESALVLTVIFGLFNENKVIEFENKLFRRLKNVSFRNK